MVKRSLKLTLVALLVTNLTRSSSATILVEEYDGGERPADADKILSPLRDELRNTGVVVEPIEINQYSWGGGIPKAGIADPTVTIAKLMDDMNAAINDGLHGRYEQAITELDAVYLSARDNEATVVLDPTARIWLTKVLVNSAAAHYHLAQIEKEKKKGRDDDAIQRHERLAQELLLEQIRSHPENPVTAADFGPEMEKSYAAARENSDHMTRGRVVIKVSRPDAEVFVDEVLQGQGSIALDLLPGLYRVLVRVGTESRLYPVNVESRPNGPAGFLVNWDVEPYVTMSPAWVGVTWPQGKAATKALGAILAKRLRPDSYIFVTIASRNGKHYLAGRVYTETGQFGRPCAIELGDHEHEKTHDLAECLQGAQPTKNIVPFFANERRPQPAQASTPKWPLYAGLASAAAFGAGLAMMIRNKNTFEPLSGTLATAGGTGALLGVTLFLLMKFDVGGPTISVSPTTSGGMATFSGSF